MELKNGYKQTEVGVIPEDWNSVALKNVVWFQEGPGLRNWQFKSSGLKVINVTNLQLNGFLDLSKTDRHISWQEFDKMYKHFLINENDVVVASSGNSYCKTALVRKVDLPLLMNTSVIRFKPIKNITFDYMYVFLKSYLFKTQIDFLITGGAQPNFGPAHLKKIFIPLPCNLAEQTAIATALSDADAYITSLEKLIEKKRQIKQGAMQELLKPKDGWVEKLLTDIVDFTHGKAHEQFIVDDGAYCVVNSKFISTEGKVSKFSNQSFLTARKNDILTVLSDLPNGKALAKCFFVDRDHYYAVNQRICIWRSKNADPKFLFYLLNRHPYFLAINDGVSQTHILNHHIKKCCINIPINKSEQENIGKILSSMDEELKGLEEKLKKAKSLKEGMMQQLLTGKIRII